MENTVNIKIVMQCMIDMTGCTLNDLSKLELEMRNAYVGMYMPNSNFMEQDEKVKELCLFYFRQQLFDFWHSVIVTGDNLYLLASATQEGIAFKLLGNGVEVWAELERQLLGKALAHISEVGKSSYKVRTQIDKIALKLMMYGDLIEKARGIKDRKEADKFFTSGKNKIFKKDE